VFTFLFIHFLSTFLPCAGHKAHYKVHLEKVVPFGGGLGGGSGNGSTALFAMNQLAGREVSEADMLTWSADLGSDCPVFFSKGAAYVTGRGEFVEDVPSPLDPTTRLLLAKPPVGLSTPEIFKALDLSKLSNVDARELMDQIASTRAVTQAQCVNDLELPSFSRLPELAALKQRLLQTRCFDTVFMTGSGSTMVGLGGDPNRVPDFLPQLVTDEGMFTAQARFITRKEGEWFRPSGLY